MKVLSAALLTGSSHIYETAIVHGLNELRDFHMKNVACGLQNSTAACSGSRIFTNDDSTKKKKRELANIQKLIPRRDVVNEHRALSRTAASLHRWCAMLFFCCLIFANFALYIFAFRLIE